MITIILRRVAETKNCVRYEASNDDDIKSALYLKTTSLTKAFDAIPDEIIIQASRSK